MPCSQILGTNTDPGGCALCRAPAPELFLGSPHWWPRQRQRAGSRAGCIRGGGELPCFLPPLLNRAEVDVETALQQRAQRLHSSALCCKAAAPSPPTALPSHQAAQAPCSCRNALPGLCRSSPPSAAPRPGSDSGDEPSAACTPTPLPPGAVWHGAGAGGVFPSRVWLPCCFFPSVRGCFGEKQPHLVSNMGLGKERAVPKPGSPRPLPACCWKGPCWPSS